jgi:hypothetical protein
LNWLADVSLPAPASVTRWVNWSKVSVVFLALPNIVVSVATVCACTPVALDTPSCSLPKSAALFAAAPKPAIKPPIAKVAPVTAKAIGAIAGAILATFSATPSAPTVSFPKLSEPTEPNVLAVPAGKPKVVAKLWIFSSNFPAPIPKKLKGSSPNNFFFSAFNLASSALIPGSSSVKANCLFLKALYHHLLF